MLIPANRRTEAGSGTKKRSDQTGLYVAWEDVVALRSSVLYTRSHAVHVTWHKKTARKRNWGDRNWLCKVKFQFRVHFRQKGGGGASPERHLAEPEWSWLTRANARTYSTVYTSFISILFNISVIMLHHRGWEEEGRDSNVSKKQSLRLNRF